MVRCSRDIMASVSDHCRVRDVDAAGVETEQQFGNDFRLGGPSLAVRGTAYVDEVAFYAKPSRESYCLIFHFGSGHSHGYAG